MFLITSVPDMHGFASLREAGPGFRSEKSDIRCHVQCVYRILASDKLDHCQTCNIFCIESGSKGKIGSFYIEIFLHS